MRRRTSLFRLLRLVSHYSSISFPFFSNDSRTASLSAAGGLGILFVSTFQSLKSPLLDSLGSC